MIQKEDPIESGKKRKKKNKKSKRNKSSKTMELIGPETKSHEQVMDSEENQLQMLLDRIKPLIVGKKEEEAIEIELPLNFMSLSASLRKGTLEKLGSIHQVEMIDNKLFIKMDGGKKENVHEDVKDSLKPQLPSWWIRSKVICMVNGNVYTPDVGAWNTEPSFAQLSAPIIEECPPPNVWIEVVFNTTDRRQSLDKIEGLLPHCPNTEFVLIVLPTSKNRIDPNPNPGAQISHAAQVQSKPSRAPYLGYWPRQASYSNVQWYKMVWNEYLDLSGCGARLVFNTVLNRI